jgi:hypothetical protein
MAGPIKLILLVFALVCLLLAAGGVRTPKLDLGWLGLAFFVATYLLT